MKPFNYPQCALSYAFSASVLPTNLRNNLKYQLRFFFNNSMLTLLQSIMRDDKIIGFNESSSPSRFDTSK